MSTMNHQFLATWFLSEDDGWCCIRPSGTEPKIKLYIGVKDESEEKAINKMEELKEELSKIIK